MWHRFRPVLAAHAGPPLRGPAPAPRLARRERTGDLRRRLAAGGYAVHGDLPEPSERPGVTAPDEDGVLALAMRVLLGPPVGGAGRPDRRARRGRCGDQDGSTSTSARPRPARRTSRTCCSTTSARLRRARHPLPRRPVRRALPGRPRPDAAALGRPRGRGDRRLGPAGRRRYAAGHGTAIISHEILAHRLAGPGRPGAGEPRPRRRHRGAPGALGARPGPPDPRRVAGERQAPRGAQLRPVPRPDPATRAREGRIATWFWGVQEIPDILDRWGHDLPPEQVHLVTVPPAGRRARPAVEAVQPRRSGSTGSTSQLDGERVNPSLGRPRDRADPADQPRPPTRSSSRADYRPLVRELLAHQTLSRRTGSARGSRCRPTSTRGRPTLEDAWIEEVARRGYDVGRRPRRPPRRRRRSQDVRRPRPPRRGRGRRRGGRRAQGAAARGRPAAARRSTTAARELLDDPAAARALRTCGRRTAGASGRVRRARGRAAPGATRCRLYRRARGRSSRSA